MSSLRLTARDPRPDPDLDEVKRAIQILTDCKDGVQIQALPSASYTTLYARDLDAAGVAVRVYSENGAAGIYYTLHPINPELNGAVTSKDALWRRWILFDIDRKKAPGTADLSATDGEKAAAMMLAQDVWAGLSELGWPDPLAIDSGNGCHLLYRIHLNNDDETRDLCRELLRAVAHRFDNDAAEVDRKVHDARRIAKLPGTWARKGNNTAERPWRRCVIMSIPRAFQEVNIDQIKRATRVYGRPADEAQPTRVDREGLRRFFQIRASAGREDAYAQSGLENEIADLAERPIGERNDGLNKAAFSIGQMVGAGWLDRVEVEEKLLGVARQIGLGDLESIRTMRNGLEAGIRQPRVLPDDECDSPAVVVVLSADPPVPGTPTAEPEVKPEARSGQRWTPPTIIKLPDLLSMKLPEPKWAVPGLLCEGLNVLAGKPKQGKSWMALNLAITIAAGGLALGTTRTEPGDVLYLSLEDKLRRVQTRSVKVLRGLGHQASGSLYIAVAWPKQGQGGLEEIVNWINDVENPRLVIIDIWQRFRPPKRGGKSDYDQDYDHANELKTVLDLGGISGLLVHHCKKAPSEDPFDDISGTNGFAGAADGLLVMTRARSENEAVLHVAGRDFEQQELALEFNPMSACWTSQGSAEDRLQGKLETAIVNYLRSLNGESAFTANIAEAINEDANKVRPVLHRLFGKRLVRHVGKAWAYPGDEETADEGSL